MNKFWQRPFGLAVCLALGLSSASQAVLKVEVTEGTEAGVPIMILPFDGEQGFADQRTYSQIIAADLSYTGLFTIVPADLALKPSSNKIDYASLLDAGIEKLVVGKVYSENGDDKVTFTLYDIVQRKQILKSVVSSADLVRSAHYISDRIYTELTGFPGIFSSRFAFVSAERFSWRKYQFTLYVSDIDGQNPIPIFNSDRQLMSPTWSPDGKRIAYISYENGQPEIVIQSLATAKRQMLGEYTGPAGSPDWSPDGKRIAYVSSRSGNPDIYVMELQNKQITRVTDSIAIDTEPTWTPEGELIFTSDRSGTPQLYQTTIKNPGPRRLTFEGKYNSDADVSANGEQITFIRDLGNEFAIMMMDTLSGAEQVLITLYDAERPRFAANGQLISHLAPDSVALLTIDGRVGKPIPMSIKHIRGIAWSPLLR